MLSRNKLPKFNPKNITIYMPNEILTELTEPIVKAKKEKDKKASNREDTRSRVIPHVAFAYSYYYYVTYLYRFCKYYDKDGNKITQKEIKQKLGYSPIYKSLDYIIKRGGVLDLLGYTETTTDIPMDWSPDEFNQVSFITSKQMDKGTFKGSDRNFNVKKPLRAFFRTEESMIEDVYDGTFYDTRNTHRIPFRIFEEFMEKETLQTVGFYLYGYLVHMCNMHKNAFQASFARIAKETGLHRTTVINYLNSMENEALINVVHQEFKFDRGDDEEKLANIYSIGAT